MNGSIGILISLYKDFLSVLIGIIISLGRDILNVSVMVFWHKFLIVSNGIISSLCKDLLNVLIGIIISVGIFFFDCLILYHQGPEGP